MNDLAECLLSTGYNTMFFKNLFNKLGNKKDQNISPKVLEERPLDTQLTQAATSVSILKNPAHPIWYRLACHQIHLETTDFSLQMLLAWAWKRSSAVTDEALLHKKANLLHACFSKKSHILQREIDQLLQQD